MWKVVVETQLGWSSWVGFSPFWEAEVDVVVVGEAETKRRAEVVVDVAEGLRVVGDVEVEVASLLLLCHPVLRPGCQRAKEAEREPELGRAARLAGTARSGRDVAAAREAMHLAWQSHTLAWQATATMPRLAPERRASSQCQRCSVQRRQTQHTQCAGQCCTTKPRWDASTMQPDPTSSPHTRPCCWQAKRYSQQQQPHHTPTASSATYSPRFC